MVYQPFQNSTFPLRTCQRLPKVTPSGRPVLVSRTEIIYYKSTSVQLRRLSVFPTLSAVSSSPFFISFLQPFQYRCTSRPLRLISTNGPLFPRELYPRCLPIVPLPPPPSACPVVMSRDWLARRWTLSSR
jgi:hypothetical protein